VLESVMADNASNVKKAINDMRLNYLPFFGHDINLIANDVLDSCGNKGNKSKSWKNCEPDKIQLYRKVSSVLSLINLHLHHNFYIMISSV